MSRKYKERRPKPVIKSVAEACPEAVSLYSPADNGELELNQISYGNNKKIYIRCKHCNNLRFVRGTAVAIGQLTCVDCCRRLRNKYGMIAEACPHIMLWWSGNGNDPRTTKASSTKKILCRCPICDRPWSPSARKILTGIKTCFNCFGTTISKTRLDNVPYHKSIAAVNPRLISEWHPTLNDKTPNKVSAQSCKKFWWVCVTCGKEWQASPSKRSYGRACPKCKKPHGEREIERVLNLLDIPFETQVRLPGMKFKKWLFMDFYIKDFDGKEIAIEFQGKGHYYPIKYSPKMTDETALTEFKVIQKRDRAKVKYCLEHDIELICIHYKSFNKIETILRERLGGKNKN